MEVQVHCGDYPLLLGEELFYVSDHTHTRSDGLGVSTHASFEGGGADCNLDLESILLEASNQFEYSGLPSTNEENISAGQLQRFATPKSDEEVERARKAYWMSRFVLEIRKKDGTEYPPNTLHHICCGILRHLRESRRVEIDFFEDVAFAEFRTTLDGEMKRLQSLGIGAKKRQAEPLTEEEEEQLWQTGQLGDHSPYALVDTTLFMHGIYFALRSGYEHRNLRFVPAQVELVDHPGEKTYLRYTEEQAGNAGRN